MAQNFRGKTIKDIETAAETYLDSQSFNSKIINKVSSNSSLSVSAQQLSEENFDTFIDKKNKS